jgi:DnaJ like chaperone protein
MPWLTIFKAIGSAEGSTLDRLSKAIRSTLGLEHRKGVDRAAFTAAVVALSAKLSIIDGVSLHIEEETFERMFSFEPDETANIRWLFRLAAKDPAGYESYARELAASLGDRPDLMRDVFEALLHVASADGILHESEDRFLGIVAQIFAYSPEKYRAIRARFVLDPADPYEVLGVPRDMANDALKARYRELVRRNHPDAAAGKGLPKELQDMATRKLAAINAAWETITRERSL